LKYDRNIGQHDYYEAQRLTDEEVDDYKALKVQLLKRFRLTEGGYRKKFKMSMLEPRLRRYLEKWRVMAGYEAWYDSHMVHLMFQFV